jgi:cell division protein FtsB
MFRKLFVLVLFLVALTIFIPGFARIQELKSKNKSLNNKISQLKKENLSLKAEVDKLKNDSVYLEGVARDKMGIVRKGEVIYRIVPEKN